MTPYTIHTRSGRVQIGAAYYRPLSPRDATPIYQTRGGSRPSGAILAWIIIAIIALAAVAVITMSDGVTAQDEAIATAASVTDAQAQAKADSHALKKVCK